MLTYKQALEDLQSYSNEIIRLRADLAEAEDERKAYISRELYITKARDKAEADLAAARGAIEDAIDTLESMNLHIDNPLYDRLRAFLERTATADAIK